MTPTELPGSVASSELEGNSRVAEEEPWVVLIGTAAAAVLSSGFNPSFLKVSVVLRSEGFKTLSLVASIVAVFTVVLIGGLVASPGVFFVALGTGSVSFPCPLSLAPSASRSFPQVRMSLCWTRGLSHTSNFSLVLSALLGLVEGSCALIPVSVNPSAVGLLSANRSDLGQRSGEMGRGNTPGGCVGEASSSPWPVSCLNQLRLVRTGCCSPDSSHDG